ncbi:MAG: winged helix-turn-helix domain-containing protein [Elusimicrobiaceae bacterium]|nr:winged helix-turn-helix domain-containing protein [Elusimicrobiaceae bacterium]
MSFKENINTAADRIFEFVKEKQEVSSWQIKINLHLSASVMYMALGQLLEQGKITLEADGINYQIKIASVQ